MINMTPKYAANLAQALEVDQRVELLPNDRACLHFKTDVDVDLVFVYIRYAWKYLRSEASSNYFLIYE